MINEFIVTNAPPTVIYLPNFISEQEEKEILKRVYAAPKPKWTQLMNRRLQNWGGIPHPKGMIPETIPEWLQKYMNKVNDLKIFGDKPPNHVLVNEYVAGQGIMPHTDGPLFYPVVSTINCGSHTLLEFKVIDAELPVTESENKTFNLLLEPRSLLILKDAVYEKYLHGIDHVTEDEVDAQVRNLCWCQEAYQIGQRLRRTTRISLTIRNVPRCSNFKLKF